MKLIRMSKAICPTCRTRTGNRKGAKDGVSVWVCEPCGKEFEVQPLKLSREG